MAAQQRFVGRATDGQYAVMSRLGVTLFQAHAAISRQLNTMPPQALPPLWVAYDDAKYDDRYQTPAVQDTIQPLGLQTQQQALFEVPRHPGVLQPTPRESSFPEPSFANPTVAVEQVHHTLRCASEDSLPLMPTTPVSSSSETVLCPRPHCPRFASRSARSRWISGRTLWVHSELEPLAAPFDIQNPPPDTCFPAPVLALAPAALARALMRTSGTKRLVTVYTLYDVRCEGTYNWSAHAHAHPHRAHDCQPGALYYPISPTICPFRAPFHRTRTCRSSLNPMTTATSSWAATRPSTVQTS